jgi:proteasome assembly chaperone (PAC2) family protein
MYFLCANLLINAFCILYTNSIINAPMSSIINIFNNKTYFEINDQNKTQKFIIDIGKTYNKQNQKNYTFIIKILQNYKSKKINTHLINIMFFYL